MIRLTHMNVNLTEEHLSSEFARAVDGDNVEGKLFGFEAFYDLPVLTKGLYISAYLAERTIDEQISDHWNRNRIQGNGYFQSEGTLLYVCIPYADTFQSNQ